MSYGMITNQTFSLPTIEKPITTNVLMQGYQIINSDKEIITGTASVLNSSQITITDQLQSVSFTDTFSNNSKARVNITNLYSENIKYGVNCGNITGSFVSIPTKGKLNFSFKNSWSGRISLSLYIDSNSMLEININNNTTYQHEFEINASRYFAFVVYPYDPNSMTCSVLASSGMGKRFDRINSGNLGYDSVWELSDDCSIEIDLH